MSLHCWRTINVNVSFDQIEKSIDLMLIDYEFKNLCQQTYEIDKILRIEFIQCWINWKLITNLNINNSYEVAILQWEHSRVATQFSWICSLSLTYQTQREMTYNDDWNDDWCDDWFDDDIKHHLNQFMSRLVRSVASASWARIASSSLCKIKQMSKTIIYRQRIMLDVICFILRVINALASETIETSTRKTCKSRSKQITQWQDFIFSRSKKRESFTYNWDESCKVAERKKKEKTKRASSNFVLRRSHLKDDDIIVRSHWRNYESNECLIVTILTKRLRLRDSLFANESEFTRSRKEDETNLRIRDEKMRLDNFMNKCWICNQVIFVRVISWDSFLNSLFDSTRNELRDWNRKAIKEFLSTCEMQCRVSIAISKNQEKRIDYRL